MTLIKNYGLMVVVTVLFWCILNESFRLSTILIGVLVSVITAIAIGLLFTAERTSTPPESLPITKLIQYVFILFIYIFKSAKDVLAIILYENDNPMIVTIKTKVGKEWPRCLIANGITLTPGTVTIDLTDDTLTVLWLNPTTNDPEEASRIIQGHFEKILMTKEDHHA